MLQTVNSFKPSQPSLQHRLIKHLADGIDPDKDDGRTAAAQELEARGVAVWLKTLFPWIFSADFAPMHIEFWEHWWSLMMRIRSIRKCERLGLPIPPRYRIEPKELVIFLLLGRALGKSAMDEASSIGRGAILGNEYALYICETSDQAVEHLGNMKQLIEHPDSRLLEFYPKMAIAENATIAGVRAKDRADIFICESGFVARAKGLDAKLRGLRIGEMRPTAIVLDDIDDVEDSIAVSVKKLRKILASIAPLPGSTGNATFVFGQNLILETGVINQLYTGKAEGFTERTTIGIHNTFKQFREGLEYVTYMDEEDGRVKHRILPEAEPTWSGVSIGTAQQFLNQSGLEVFLAEYQNQFDHLKTDKVFPAYDEARHIVEWSDFERVFGSRYIPPNWQAKAAADFGYSQKSISAWMFTAASAQNTPLPGHYFCYRSMSFHIKSIDDQAVAVWEAMFPDHSIGKHHFEATQEFADYPELFRLLKLSERCSPYMDDAPERIEATGIDHIASRKEPQPTDEGDRYMSIAKQNFAGQIVDWRVSHEKTGEQKTLAQKYGLPVSKTKHFGANDGIREANHLLRGDMTQPHPFHEDVKLPNGLYKLGRPFIYFVIEDGQKLRPINDAGMKTFREHVANQRMTEEKLKDTGLTRSVPMKYLSDHGDAFRIFASDYALPDATERTVEEEVEMRIPKAVRAKFEEGGVVTKGDQQRYEFAKRFAEQQVMEKLGEDVFDDEEDDDHEFGDWW